MKMEHQSGEVDDAKILFVDYARAKRNSHRHIFRQPKRKLARSSLPDRGFGHPGFLEPSLFTEHSLYDTMVGALVGVGWRATAIDRPGVGRSQARAAFVQPQTYADVVIELAVQLQLTQIASAECSSGRLVAVRFAELIQEPARMATLDPWSAIEQ